MSHKHHKAVIFDMDGLLLDTERVAQSTWIEAAAEFGYQLQKEQYAQVIGRKLEDTYRIFRELFGQDFPAEAIRNRRLEMAEQFYEREGIPLRPGALEILQLLSEHDIPLAVATSTANPKAKASLLKAGITRYFRAVVAGNEVTNGKPAPDIYLKAAQSLEMAPAFCLVFEDSPAGIQAAAAARMTPIMIPDLVTPSVAIQNLTFRVLSSLSEAIPLIPELFPVDNQQRRGNDD